MNHKGRTLALIALFLVTVITGIAGAADRDEVRTAHFHQLHGPLDLRAHADGARIDAVDGFFQTCAHCNGTGRTGLFQTCSVCKGSGKTWRVLLPCGWCHGTGWANPRFRITCGFCKGTGRVL